MVAGCVGLGVLLYRAGVFDEAPDLPAFARPPDARQVRDEEVRCYMTDDIGGPYAREMVFETDLYFDEVAQRLVPEFERRGWTVLRPGDRDAEPAEYLVAVSPGDDLVISFEYNRYSSDTTKATTDREPSALIEVRISSCA
jgi:hypothetical protein